MTFKRFSKSLAILLSLFVLLPHYANAKESAIVIFDASGSMKKAVNGMPKIDVAREVMGSLMQDWNKDIDLGLMVYGHRSKACDDIEMLLPVGKPEPTKLLEAIKAIVPKGETPIGASLKQAAEHLNYIESPTTIILVSDGEESCQTDPCAAAKELEKNGVNFTAHVIGFDVSDKSKAKAYAQLKCVAESTGGKFFAANDAEGLKNALAETAKTIAKPAPVEVPEAIAPVEAGVQLSAIPAEGAEPFSSKFDLSYTVYAETQDSNAPYKQVESEGIQAQTFIKLEAGNYKITAKRGNAMVDTLIEVKAGEKTEHVFNLNVGNLKITSIPAEGTKAFSKKFSVSYTVYNEKTDMDGRRETIDSDGISPKPLFKLAAGKYIVTAKRGNATEEVVIEVKAGVMVEHTFNLNSGNLKLQTLPEKGVDAFTKKFTLDYKVYENKKDMEGQRLLVDSDGINPQPLFKLAARQYVIIIKRADTGEQIEQVIEIKAGELLEHTVIFGKNTPSETPPATPKTSTDSIETTPTVTSETTSKEALTEIPAAVPKTTTAVQ